MWSSRPHVNKAVASLSYLPLLRTQLLTDSFFHLHPRTLCSSSSLKHLFLPFSIEWTHPLSSRMFECASCDYEFYNEQDCDNHMEDYDHWAECETCDRQFRSERAAEQHMDALDHWALYKCETCTREFGSEAALDQHMRAKKHFERYCPDCDREFSNSNGLHMVWFYITCPRRDEILHLTSSLLNV